MPNLVPANIESFLTLSLLFAWSPNPTPLRITPCLWHSLTPKRPSILSGVKNCFTNSISIIAPAFTQAYYGLLRILPQLCSSQFWNWYQLSYILWCHASVLGYADDIALIADSIPLLLKLFQNCYHYSMTHHFVYNLKKCVLTDFHAYSHTLSSINLNSTSTHLIGQILDKRKLRCHDTQYLINSWEYMQPTLKRWIRQFNSDSSIITIIPLDFVSTSPTSLSTNLATTFHNLDLEFTLVMNLILTPSSERNTLIVIMTFFNLATDTNILIFKLKSF